MTSSSYLAFYFKVKPLQPTTNILIAQLADIGFESFAETTDGVSAFIKTTNFNKTLWEAVQILNSDEFAITYTSKIIEQENWNKIWEESFNPINIDSRCTIRAPFHKKTQSQYDIVIEPKMSFGTGHHETTYLMLQYLLDINLEDKTVLDVGCGTAVLSILAEKRGAKSIDAIDIDQWSYSNSLDNIIHNHCKAIQVYHGDIKMIKPKTYDIILANINRNVLLNQISVYTSCLNKNGLLILSGFYDDDIGIISAECEINHLKISQKRQKNNWIALQYIKTSYE